MNTVEKLESQLRQVEDNIKTLEAQAEFIKALIVMMKEYDKLVKRAYVKPY